MKKFGMSLLFATALLVGGCTAQDVDDSTLTATVKSKLSFNTDTSAMKIGVETTNGVVTLTGNVPTVTERNRAEEVATKTDGVKRVVNNLAVIPEAVTSGTTGKKADDPMGKAKDKTEKALDKSGDVISDATILTMIKAHLLSGGFSDTDVDVADGKVVLKGFAESAKDRSEAEAYARKIKGVKSVSNRLVVRKSAA